jgi:hypothetical protein
MGPSELAAAPAPVATITPIPVPIVIAPTTPPPVEVAPVSPTPTPTPTTPTPTPTPKTRPAPAKLAGTFRLSTTTWAYASIDGGPQQEVSMMKKFSLPAGRHTVRISNDELGLKSVSRPIVIEANKNRVWKVDLESGSVKEIE